MINLRDPCMYPFRTSVSSPTTPLISPTYSLSKSHSHIHVTSPSPFSLHPERDTSPGLALPGSRIPLGRTTHAERVHAGGQVEGDRKWRKFCQELEGAILALVRVHIANYLAFICIILWATIRSPRVRPGEPPQTAPHFALVHLAQRRVPLGLPFHGNGPQ